jgi:hypothetical protein
MSHLYLALNAEALPDGWAPATGAVQIKIKAEDRFGFTAPEHNPFRQVIPIPHRSGHFGIIRRRRRLDGKRTTSL